MKKYCDSLTVFHRRPTHAVYAGSLGIGGDNPVRLQSMTNTDTNDTSACTEQILRIAQAGGELVRLTAQGRREAANLANIRRQLNEQGCLIPLAADIHFQPAAALEAALHIEKVRINPGNFNDRGGQLDELIERCRRRNVALRIGVNHGSLSPNIVERYGDTPEGMVASALEYLTLCRERHFDQIVVSLKSSNVRVMVHAYRLLAATLREQGLTYPLHLGVTEAGDDLEGRVKSAVGIGALLADGLGDTIRVSLTEAPEREIPVARLLAEHFANRSGHPSIPAVNESLYHPYEYHRRISRAIGPVGGGQAPCLWHELPEKIRAEVYVTDMHELDRIPEDKIVVLTTDNPHGIAEQRAFFLQMEALGKDNPVIIKRTYHEKSLEALQVKAAADTGMLFLDGYGDGLWIENEGPDSSISQADIDALGLCILQAARVRISRAEYIACPGCGRTLYDLQQTLAQIKARTFHLTGIKIGVMGCIVNGPGEMADADYGYVGAGPGRITLYKGREVVCRNIPQQEALDALINLLRKEGVWKDPDLSTSNNQAYD